MKGIILVGGGGHCKVVISVLRDIEEYEIVGISDIEENLGKEILGVPIGYTDDQLERLRRKGVEYALVTVGSVGDPSKRVNLFHYLKSLGFTLPIVVSPKAVVSEDVELGEGTVVLPGAIINPGAKIGKNAIVNTGAIVEHDCVIGDHTHIAPGAVLSGNVYVGCCSHVGAGANVIQNIKIGAHTIVGAGAVVVKDIPSNVVAKGVPARW